MGILPGQKGTFAIMVTDRHLAEINVKLSQMISICDFQFCIMLATQCQSLKV